MKEWHSLSIAAIIENKSRLELCDDVMRWRDFKIFCLVPDSLFIYLHSNFMFSYLFKFEI